MKKKITLVATSVLLVAAMVIGGTLAYFTDTDKATNTMTVGNIGIHIAEWQYGENGWEDYEDGSFTLYPIDNVQGIALYNKSVRTYNNDTSSDKAYIRSIILIEKNDELPASHVNDGGECCFPGIHYAYDNNPNAPYTSSYDSKQHYSSKQGGSLDKTVTVGDNEYWVAWFVEAQDRAIPQGAALSSLHSVYMDKNITDDYIDGWGDNGVQIIAFSQGIQAEGLSHAEAMDALGEVTVENVESWLAE